MASEFGHPRLLPTHRLDRLTSGCVILARNSEAASRISEFIRQDGAIQKEYVAMTHGVFPVVEGGDGFIEVDKPIAVFEKDSGVCVVDEVNGKPSFSAFQVLWSDVERNISVVKCFPRTGRTHQLRVHLQYLGHPIVGDPLYGLQATAERVVDSDGRTKQNYEGMCFCLFVCCLAFSLLIRSICDDTDEVALGTDMCAECATPLFADPKESQLCIHLHALRYRCAEFDISTPLPKWAIQ